jgi:hypothetical protein
MGEKVTTTKPCERCGKHHLSTVVWLELNTVTGLYSQPGTVPAEASQGVFPFGPTCAARVLKDGGKNTKRIRPERRPFQWG